MFNPRHSQAEVLAYAGGYMGVSAVPGSGKTQTLSALAANLISSDLLAEDQEVLVVTLVNSAVDNFTSRIEGFLKHRGLMPGMGYRVRTLHGLSHDIVRERPDLVGLSDRFLIVDEREAETILQRVSAAWLKEHPEFVEDWIDPDLPEYQRTNLHRQWPDLVAEIGGSFIRMAKDLEQTPVELRRLLDSIQTSHPLLEMGWEIYFNYQRDLNYRGAVDFDDLIRLAIRALRLDHDFLDRLRGRWPYILEDEAQDSSRLQESILRMLAGDDGNWVRVGDPNQAIYETFTTANPKFLRDFLKAKGVIKKELPVSGRSANSIIELANALIRWTKAHPIPELRTALDVPEIDPTLPGDPQPNPADTPGCVYLSPTKYSPDNEVKSVVRNIQQWLPEHQDQTVAVLVPRNERGVRVVDALRVAGVEVVELLRASQSTRQSAALLAAIFKTLADPTSPARLAALYDILHRSDEDRPERKEIVKSTIEIIRRCPRLEEYLAPKTGRDWLEELGYQGIDENILHDLSILREQVRRWQAATLLPVDQLLLTISQELFIQPTELALAHKLALALERSAVSNPTWDLEHFAAELESIAQNRRKFLGFADEDTGFDPDQHKGKVVVATIHKAKGLEWDRVYLMSVNNYDFPSCEPIDEYRSERWFIKGKLNLPVECIARLQALEKKEIENLYMEDGVATIEARTEYAAERLRLLFVGITRARRSLVITWNNGRKNNCTAAAPLLKLREWWEQRYVSPA